MNPALYTREERFSFVYFIQPSLLVSGPIQYGGHVNLLVRLNQLPGSLGRESVYRVQGFGHW